MKRLTIYITVILLIVNLLLGFVLSGYKPFNVGFTSVVILITGIMELLLQVINLRNAFAISLAFIFVITGAIAFVLGISSPQHLEDNYHISTAIILLAINIILLLICNIKSKTIK